jgi:hemerythrin-like domain-containing protein
MTGTAGIAAVLHAEHQHALAVLGTVEELVEAQRQRPLDPAQPRHRTALDALIAVIDRDLLRHYRFEEQVLFPRLAAVGLCPVTDMLTLEHDSVRAIAAELREVLLAAMAQGFSPDSWDAFRSLVEDLTFSATFHIQKEETGVIRPLALLLGADENEALGEAYQGFA